MSLSATARPDMDALLNFLLNRAEEHVTRHGEFHPFGGAVTSNGELVLKAADPGLGEFPPAQAVIELLVRGLRQEAAIGAIRAAAICYDSRVQTTDQPKSDAIAVRSQHRTGEAVECFLPYKRGFFRRVKFGELIATSTTFSVFTPEESAT